jgi:hypothetical protein
MAGRLRNVNIFSFTFSLFFSFPIIFILSLLRFVVQEMCRSSFSLLIIPLCLLYKILQLQCNSVPQEI